MPEYDNITKENMITSQDIGFVESRSWYQTIDFDEKLRSKGCEWCGEIAWRNISSLLPSTLDGCRVLDLGCNAGLFCVKAALMGAKEVIGVDWPSWRPNWDFIEQQIFVRDFFERKYNRKLPITYDDMNMEDYLNRRDIGMFDYVFGIASLYYTENPRKVVQNISYIAKNVITRIRDQNRLDLFSGLFKKLGFKEVAYIDENLSQELGIQADDFRMFLYKIKHGKGLKLYTTSMTGSSVLNIWQLMELIGTEIPIGEYREKILPEYITYVPIRKFARFKEEICYRPSKEETYPWLDLVASIRQRGFLIPIPAIEIEEEGKKLYIELEGRHRVAATSMVDPYYLIPCVIVKREINDGTNTK